MALNFSDFGKKDVRYLCSSQSSWYGNGHNKHCGNGNYSAKDAINML